MSQPANITIVKTGGAPNILLRLIWFLLVGWWLGQIVLVLGWLLNLTVIGLPLGIALLNALPGVFTLHNAQRTTVMVAGAVVSQDRAPGFWLRAAYFVLIGWWASLIWLETAWLLCLIIVGLPLGFWMFGRVGQVTTLAVA